MKKLLGCMILLFCMMLGGTVVYAQVGDVIGNIYATDIVTYINGMKIPSYNIGGETVIVVEDLEKYGFQVDWIEEVRLLEVNAKRIPETAPEYIPPKNSSLGKPIGKIYETDICVDINGYSVDKEKVYNIGGKTAVEVSAISDINPNIYSYENFKQNGYSSYGFRFVWNAEERTVEIEAIMGGKEIQTDFGMFLLDSICVEYPYISNYTDNQKIYESFESLHESYESIPYYSFFQTNGIFYFSDYPEDKYMRLKPLLEMADITLKECKENMFVLEKGKKDSLHTYDDKDPICVHPQQYCLGSITLKSNNTEKEISAFVYAGEIYIRTTDISDFIGMPYSYTCVDYWVNGKSIDKIVTP